MSAVLKQDLDQSRIDAFEERLCGALNEAGMLLMMSLGHRSGLFDAMAGAAPVTSSQLAERSGLDERYVREWLGAMTASGIVEVDPAHATYTLPDEHAALITRHAEANLAVYAQFIPLLGAVEDDVLESFRRGGGVPYQRYARFHEVMAEDSGQTVLPALFDPRVALAVPPTEFMGVTLAGNWWVVAVWTGAFVVNIGGEELLWRGYLLPRQEAVFGRWAWLVNGLLWVVAVHAFMWWNLFGLLPTGLVTPYLVQRYGTTWAGVVVHGLGNALWLVLLVVGVVG